MEGFTGAIGVLKIPAGATVGIVVSSGSSLGSLAGATTTIRLATAVTQIPLRNPALFARVKALYDARDTLGLDAESKRVLWRYYKDFVRGGVKAHGVLSDARHGVDDDEIGGEMQRRVVDQRRA